MVQLDGATCRPIRRAPPATPADNCPPRAFLEVAEFGSVIVAAECLHPTQTAVSARVTDCALPCSRQRRRSEVID